MNTSLHVVSMAQMACLLEASATKPGNVSPGRPFRDVCYEDFVASAVAIGEPLRGAADRPLGAAIRMAIEATQTWTSANTNLGIVLLLTPLVKAAFNTVGPVDQASLRRSLEQVLGTTTVQDARDVYAAIRAAAPGGLGTAPAQDVSAEPTVDLQATMRLAAHRDTIAREYVSTFDTTFTIGVPALEHARGDGLAWNEAVVETFLALVAETPDTHITRRAGESAAIEVSRAARGVIESGGVRTESGRQALKTMDEALRDPMHARNPGTSADLTCASIFVVLMGGGWNRQVQGAPLRGAWGAASGRKA